MTDFEEYPVVTEKSRAHLNERQRLDYRTEREACIEWLLSFGKHPKQAVGYAPTTVKPRCARMDRFYRFVWDRDDGCTANVGHDQADAWMRHLAHRDVSGAHKRNCLKALKMLFKWRHHQQGLAEWSPEFTFATESSIQPKDFLTRDERSAIREAALNYGSVPSYNNLSPAERERWKRYLAQRFEKPKSAVQPEDWDRANGWKVPSLVWTSLDAGLGPIEVKQSLVSWIDTENAVLRIPKEMSAKNREHWVVGLSERTAKALTRWQDERETYPKYDDTEAIWLTREGNRYGAGALKYLFEQLCEIAEIDTNRFRSPTTIGDHHRPSRRPPR